MSVDPVVVIGAGPAGLAAANELARQAERPIVLEKSDKAGGISRTEVYGGYRFDIGGHRYFTKVEEVRRLWREMLGPDMIEVPRHSHVYYHGKFFKYPLEPLDVLGRLGFGESALSAISYIRARIHPYPEERTLEQWVVNHFGRRLFEAFFRTYTEKVWGLPCSEIQADWAAQRIRDLSLRAAIWKALFGFNRTRSMIGKFDYPRLGPGMMWEAFCRAIVQGGGQVLRNTEATKLLLRGRRVCAVEAWNGGETAEIPCRHVIASMPLPDLIARLDPAPPDAVLQAARGLGHRDFIVVGLILGRNRLTEDQWLYIQSSDTRTGRIQNFKNWSRAMVLDPRKTSVGVEYFCSMGDDLWAMSDAELIDLAAAEMTKLGLIRPHDVEDGVVFRQSAAYPTYDGNYQRHLRTIRAYLATLENAQTVGRNGMHRYNNMDHSMLTGILAARNLAGERHDLWSVNTEQGYAETASARAEI